MSNPYQTKIVPQGTSVMAVPLLNHADEISHPQKRKRICDLSDGAAIIPHGAVMMSGNNPEVPGGSFASLVMVGEANVTYDDLNPIGLSASHINLQHTSPNGFTVNVSGTSTANKYNDRDTFYPGDQIQICLPDPNDTKAWKEYNDALIAADDGSFHVKPAFLRPLNGNSSAMSASHEMKAITHIPDPSPGFGQPADVLPGFGTLFEDDYKTAARDLDTTQTAYRASVASALFKHLALLLQAGVLRHGEAFSSVFGKDDLDIAALTENPPYADVKLAIDDAVAKVNDVLTALAVTTNANDIGKVYATLHTQIATIEANRNLASAASFKAIADLFRGAQAVELLRGLGLAEATGGDISARLAAILGVGVTTVIFDGFYTNLLVPAIRACDKAHEEITEHGHESQTGVEDWLIDVAGGLGLTDFQGEGNLPIAAHNYLHWFKSSTSFDAKINEIDLSNILLGFTGKTTLFDDPKWVSTLDLVNSSETLFAQVMLKLVGNASKWIRMRAASYSDPTSTKVVVIQ
jgi:hypothetical protein